MPPMTHSPLEAAKTAHKVSQRVVRALDGRDATIEFDSLPIEQREVLTQRVVDIRDRKREFENVAHVESLPGALDGLVEKGKVNHEQLAGLVFDIVAEELGR